MFNLINELKEFYSINNLNKFYKNNKTWILEKQEKIKELKKKYENEWDDKATTYFMLFLHIKNKVENNKKINNEIYLVSLFFDTEPNNSDNNEIKLQLLIPLLLEANCKKGIWKDQFLFLILQNAIKFNYKEIQKLVLDTSNIINTDSKEKALIHLATIDNNYKMTELLLKNGTDVNLADDAGLTPLHYAVIKNNNKIIKLLLSYNADIKKSSKAYSPISMALINSASTISILLLKHKSNLKDCNKDLTWTLLILIKKNNYTMIEILLKNYDDKNICDNIYLFEKKLHLYFLHYN